MSNLPEDIAEEFGLAAAPPKSSLIPPLVMAAVVAGFLGTVAVPKLYDYLAFKIEAAFTAAPE